MNEMPWVMKIQFVKLFTSSNTNQSPTEHFESTNFNAFLASKSLVWVMNLESKRQRTQSKNIVQTRQRKVIADMNIKVTIQNQMARQTFSFMIFWERTQRPLWCCSPPADPILGTTQLTSVGKTWQSGFTWTFCSNL